jgi:hypothetical protein
MATALDIITGALRLIGAIATGETPSADETRDGLGSLNDVLETWSIDGLTVYTQQEQIFSATPGQQDYTLGPGATWNGARPVSVLSAVARWDGRDHPLELLSPTRWTEIERKGFSSDPCALRYRADFPAGLVRLWPVPQRAMPIVMASALPFAPLTSAAQQLVLPDGYARALRFNLALELAPEFGIEPGAVVVAAARSSKAALKRANQPDPPQLDVQPLVRCGLDAFIAGDL